ncbi:MAG: dephospho-CoA kinase [Bacteriovoracaceae bacterium]|jgi:dephospho-CoA kinase
MHKLKSNYIKLFTKNRLYNTSLPIIALTGGIATGKSTVAKILHELGVPVIDADCLIKLIYRDHKTIKFINKVCPKAIVENDIIDFKILREEFFKTEDLKVRIENFLYERLPLEFEKELKKLDFNEYEFLVYDIPLLFEKKLQSKFDLNILVYCSPEIQIQRLMKRDHIKKVLAQNILSQQIDIETKKSLSDLIILNNGTKEELLENTSKLLKSLIIKS